MAKIVAVLRATTIDGFEMNVSIATDDGLTRRLLTTTGKTKS